MIRNDTKDGPELTQQEWLAQEYQKSAGRNLAQNRAYEARQGRGPAWCPRTGRDAAACDTPDHRNCPQLAPQNWWDQVLQNWEAGRKA